MSQDIKEVILELIEKEGLEVPKEFGSQQNREIYRAFLGKKGFTEKNVSPIIEKSKIPPEAMGTLLAALIQASQSNDKKLLNVVVNMFATIFLEQSTNVLVAQMIYRLLADLDDDFTIPRDFFAGVFPTNSINAQCRIEQGVPLVLIDSGCFEMVEAAMTTYVSKRNETEKARLLISFLEDYFLKGLIPDAEKANHPSINWGDMTVSTFSNSIEEFILMHELGHLALGHLGENEIHAIPHLGSTLSLQKRSHQREYEADVWALSKLIDRAKKQKDPQFAVELASSGALIFLNIGLMLEALCKSRNYPIHDTHPPTSNRIYVLEVTLELLGFPGLRGYSGKFKRLIREVCVLEEVEEISPPFLDRELNRVARQVYENLNMNYDHLEYLIRFI